MAQLRAWNDRLPTMPHRHPLAVVLYFGAILVILNFVVDVATGAFPEVVAVRGVKQAVTGA